MDNHDAERFVYVLSADENEERGNNYFNVAEIKLLDSGWVLVRRHDGGVECFPPSRVVDLEASCDFETFEYQANAGVL